MEEQRRFVQQPFRRPDAFDDNRLGILAQFRFLGLGQVLARVDDHGNLANPLVLTDPLQQFKAVHVAQSEVEDHGVEGVVRQRCERLAAGRHRGDRDIAGSDQLAEAGPLSGVVLDQQQASDGFADHGFDAFQSLVDAFVADGFRQEADRAPFQRFMPAVRNGHDVHRNVTGLGRRLEPFEDGPAVHPGQLQIQDHGAGLAVGDGCQGLFAAARQDAGESAFLGDRGQDLGKARVVLDDQQPLPAGVTRLRGQRLLRLAGFLAGR